MGRRNHIHIPNLYVIDRWTGWIYLSVVIGEDGHPEKGVCIAKMKTDRDGWQRMEYLEEPVVA
jgi:hypothetical protein